MQEESASEIDRIKVLEFVRTCYSDLELHDLCFYLTIDYESLPGQGRDAKARELVDYCERHDLTQQLLSKLRQDRSKQFAKSFPPELGTTPLSQLPDLQRGINSTSSTSSKPAARSEKKTIETDKLSSDTVLQDQKIQQVSIQAGQLLEQRDFDKAVKLLRQYRRTDTDHSGLEDLFIEVLYQQGVHVYLRNDLAKAKLIFQEVVQLDPAYEQAAQYLREAEQRLRASTLHRSILERLATAGSFDYKWIIGALIVAFACVAALPVVPEVRQLLRLDKPTPISTPMPALIPGRVGFRCTLSSTGNSDDKFCADVVEIQPQPVSSISISMTNRDIPIYGYSIWEVEAYETITSTTNLISTTVGMQATATSKEDDVHLPQAAIDGNMLTRWASAWSDKSDGKDPQVLTITFPKSVTVGRIVIKWQNAYARDYWVAIR
jgi:hypothetical protein